MYVPVLPRLLHSAPIRRNRGAGVGARAWMGESMVIVAVPSESLLLYNCPKAIPPPRNVMSKPAALKYGCFPAS